MEKFFNATTDDFNNLFKLVKDFELHKQATYDKEDKADIDKLLKEKKKELKTFLKDKSYCYIVCKKKNEFIGYIFLSHGDIYATEGYINEIYVVPVERKNGIGKKLITKGFQWLKQHKCETVDLVVNKKNKAALSLFKNSGFGKFNDSYISMAKILTPGKER